MCSDEGRVVDWLLDDARVDATAGYCRVALQQAKACGAELTWHRRRRCLPKGPLAALVTDEGIYLAIPRYSSCAL